MNNESMANFICELRKAKNLTQKQLAEQLKITDKAVSKWERGLGYPDITVLTKLAEILGVTTNELLNGSREESPTPKTDVIVQSTLQYAEKVSITNNKNVFTIMKFIITSLFILAILVCIICDLSISKGLTWSYYPISSIVFAWLVIVPLFHYKEGKLCKTLISLSIFVIPYLLCIQQIGETTQWLLPLGVPISIVSIIFLWVVFFLFKKSSNKWFALAATFAMALVLSILIEFIVSRFTGEPFFDVWDAMSIAIDTLVVTALLIIGCFRSKNLNSNLLKK